MIHFMVSDRVCSWLRCFSFRVHSQEILGSEAKVSNASKERVHFRWPMRSIGSIAGNVLDQAYSLNTQYFGQCFGTNNANTKQYAHKPSQYIVSWHLLVHKHSTEFPSQWKIRSNSQPSLHSSLFHGAFLFRNIQLNSFIIRKTKEPVRDPDFTLVEYQESGT